MNRGMALPGSNRAVAGFFLRTLFWLAISLTVWYLARDFVVRPAAWLAGEVMRTTFPYWVTGTELTGTQQTLLTKLMAQDAGGRWGQLSPEVNVLTYAYGAPLLAALLAAVRSRGWWWKIPVGAVALVPLQAWGVVFGWLLQVTVVSAPAVQQQLRFDAWETNLVAAGYQFGFLLLPTLGPIVLWLLFDRRLVAEVMLEGALGEPG